MNDTTSDAKALFTSPLHHIKPASANGIARRGIAVFLVQVLGVAVAFATQILLARLLGKEQYGVHTYVLSWMTIFLLPAVFGMDTMSLRFLSSYTDSNENAKAEGLVRFSRLIVLATSLLSSTIAISVIYFLVVNSIITVELAICFSIGLAAIPLAAQMNLNTGLLRACRKPAFASSLVNPIRPGLIALFISSVYLLLPDETTAKESLISYLLATFLVVVIGIKAFHSHCRKYQASATTKEHEKRIWIESAWPLMLTSSFQMVIRQCDVIMIGYFIGLTQAGMYFAATRMVGLVAFGLNATNAVVAPMISAAYASNRTEELRKTLRSSAATVFGLTIPMAILMLLLGKWGLSQFGDGFSSAYPALVILCGGQIFNALCGCVGYLLIMTGNERAASRILFFTALLNIGLNATFIPIWGMFGAACATTFTLVVWNLWMMVVVWKRLRLNPTILSWLYR